jgi:Holliday junction DNA helicase RuvA
MRLAADAADALAVAICHAHFAQTRDDCVIGFVRGKLVVKTPPHLTVDVGGVGYDIEAPMSTFYTLPAVGSDVRLLTHLVVARGRTHPFGFATQKTRAGSATCSGLGVGPKHRAGVDSLGVSVEGFAKLRV